MEKKIVGRNWMLSNELRGKLKILIINCKNHVKIKINKVLAQTG